MAEAFDSVTPRSVLMRALSHYEIACGQHVNGLTRVKIADSERDKRLVEWWGGELRRVQLLLAEYNK